MRDFGGGSFYYAVSAGEVATAATPPDIPQRAWVSSDGCWWWNGVRWVPTASEDGLWRWDGARWRPALDLSRARPRDLATTVTLLAEDRYAWAAAILVERAAEWRPEGELLELVARTTTTRQRRRRIDRARPGAASRSGRHGLLRRLTATRDRRHPAEELAPPIDSDHRALLVRIGRSAQPPTVKEADDLLKPARLLDARAVRLTQAQVAMDEAERARGIATESAHHDLETAESARRDAVAAAGRAITIAEEAHAEATRNAQARLREVLAPEPGEVLAAVGPLRAGAESVATPEGRLPLAGMVVAAGTALSLYRQHRQLLTDLIGLDTRESAALADCLIDRRSDLFLLLLARSRVVVWQCPRGEEKVAWRFSQVVRRRAAEATALAREQDVAAREAELIATWRGRAAALDEARAALARVETDPELLDAVQRARARLARSGEPSPELEAAVHWVREEVRALVTPPEALPWVGS